MPFALAIVAVASTVLLSLSHSSAHLVNVQRATTAADALALAVATHRGVAQVVTQHDIADFVASIDDDVVTVSIVRNGVAATAIAHRHTLTSEQ
ncbi:MAG: hypothetical protein NWS59_05865 [Ilumatobacteraceae bacterium]|jgi:hypothetical protein|nr:hypothetical protein [Ilumatobacteraceae bacterium]